MTSGSGSERQDDPVEAWRRACPRCCITCGNYFQGPKCFWYGPIPEWYTRVIPTKCGKYMEPTLASDVPF